MSRYGGGGPSWRDRDRDRPPREMSFHDDRGRGPPEMDDRRFDERRGGGRRMDDRSWEDRRRFKPVKKIDREKVCPFLLRVFPMVSSHHKEEEYISHSRVPSDEIHTYTWLDATFGEITALLRHVNEQMQGQGVRLSYSLVTPNQQGRYTLRQVANVNVQYASEGDGALTLGQVGLEPGDFLDVAIYSRRNRY